jgi:hypothetical protein
VQKCHLKNNLNNISSLEYPGNNNDDQYDNKDDNENAGINAGAKNIANQLTTCREE